MATVVVLLLTAGGGDPPPAAHAAPRRRTARPPLMLDALGSSRSPDASTPNADERLLRFQDLHPSIVLACRDLYETGNYVEAVEKSFKVVRDRLRVLSGYETGSEAFGKGKLRVQGASALWVEDDFNEAVKFLTMAIDRFRNEKAHTADANIADSVRAAEYLAMSSLAMRLLDRAYLSTAE